ncbi:PqqD family protein [Peribacillus frigoritolerans]|uniref:PqqD family protein n=1 Tax=Peribacillus frigoritolerans TaxID=450367 RepID=UPI001F4F1830|nr:PqqD family protein [Peribacillus frigoritolerans]MCK2020675.1 PqqD family protein [Peribacillus frigoritolerans]
MNISGATLTKRSRYAVINVDSGGVLSVNNPVTGRVFVLNDVGRRVLELSDGATPFSDIVNRVCTEFYGAQREQVQEEIEEFLKACNGAQLIEY